MPYSNSQEGGMWWDHRRSHGREQTCLQAELTWEESFIGEGKRVGEDRGEREDKEIEKRQRDRQRYVCLLR